MHEEKQNQGQGCGHGHDGPPLEPEPRVGGTGHGSQDGEASYRDTQRVHGLILLQSSVAWRSRHGGQRPRATYAKGQITIQKLALKRHDQKVCMYRSTKQKSDLSH